MATQAVQQDIETSHSEHTIQETPDVQTQNLKRFSSYGGASRKRKRDSVSWKQNIRKKRRQSGKSYVNTKCKNISAKTVKTKKNCMDSCKFKCSQNICDDERKQVFQSFWSMGLQEQKHFFNNTTERKPKQRCRTKKGKDSCKSFSYYYHFIVNGMQYRVCKDFYLTTLDISSRRVSYFHENKNEETSVPAMSKWGKHAKKKLPDECKQAVRDHINSIPTIESHYCRSVTQKQYFEGNLNLTKLYELYATECKKKCLEPAKIHVYRDIFNHEFNIEF